jgi:group I intron endonuclease
MTYFIYCIKNTLDFKLYIGFTANPANRRYWHLRGYSHCPALAPAIKKYGRENFEFSIIEECDCLEEACDREVYWIKGLKTQSPFGYNISPGGEGTGSGPENPNYGKHMSSERKQKLSEALKGNTRAKGHVPSLEHRRRISEANKGRRFTPEHKRKLSEAHRGKPLSAEHRRRIGKAHKGRAKAEEWKHKIGESVRRTKSRVREPI